MRKWCGTLSAAALLMLSYIACGDNGMSNGDRKLYLDLVHRVRTGEIKTDEEKGVALRAGSVRLPQSATLPSSLRSASMDGEIYIFRSSSNQLFVIFKTWRGKGFNMEGYLYAAMPLTSRDTHRDYYGANVITLGPIDFALKKQLDENWYRVSYKLD